MSKLKLLLCIDGPLMGVKVGVDIDNTKIISFPGIQLDEDKSIEAEIIYKVETNKATMINDERYYLKYDKSKIYNITQINNEEAA